MPKLIEHIDAIARRLQRDALFVQFHDGDKDFEFAGDDWESSPARRRTIAWLKAHRIGWSECAGYAGQNFNSFHEGQLYIDVLMDPADTDFSKLVRYLEFPDGRPRRPGVWLCAVKLDAAMTNAHLDAAGLRARLVGDS